MMTTAPALRIGVWTPSASAQMGLPAIGLPHIERLVRYTRGVCRSSDGKDRSAPVRPRYRYGTREPNRKCGSPAPSSFSGADRRIRHLEHSWRARRHGTPVSRPCIGETQVASRTALALSHSAPQTPHARYGTSSFELLNHGAHAPLYILLSSLRYTGFTHRRQSPSKIGLFLLF